MRKKGKENTNDTHVTFKLTTSKLFIKENVKCTTLNEIP